MNDSTALDALPPENFRPASVAVPAGAEELTQRRRELEALYRSHCGKFAGYFRMGGVNAAQAAELAQETFIKGLLHLDQFNGQAKLSTWLWSIARNVLATHHRSAKPYDRVSDEEPLDPDTLTHEPEARLTDMQDCVCRGMAAFSAEHPERALTVYLAVVMEYSTQELAAHLGRTPGAAAEYLSQCKARLRPYIKGCLP